MKTTEKFKAAGKEWTVIVPEGGTSGGIAKVAQDIPVKFNEKGQVVLDEELASIISGFINAIEAAGKDPQQIYLQCRSGRLTGLFLHSNPSGEKPVVEFLGG